MLINWGVKGLDLSENKQRNMVFICFFNSWYHYLGFLSYLKENNIFVERIIVLRGGFLSKKARIDISNLSAHTSRIEEVEFLENVRGVLRPEFEKYVMVSASPYPYRLHKLLKQSGVKAGLLVIEEGLGTYASYISRIVAHYRIGRAARGIQGWLKAVGLIVKSHIRAGYFFDVKPVYWLNFDRRVTSVDAKVVSGYIKALTEICSGTQCEVLAGKRVVLFISSPFCELGMVESKEYLGFLKKYFQGKGQLYIKPHPAEDVSKYDFLNAIIIDPTIPVEKLAYYMSRDSEIYSFSSTSLYTLRIFYGLTVIRINQMDFLYKKLSMNQKRIIDGGFL